MAQNSVPSLVLVDTLDTKESFSRHIAHIAYTNSGSCWKHHKFNISESRRHAAIQPIARSVWSTLRIFELSGRVMNCI
jgi:hypothetical protein